MSKTGTMKPTHVLGDAAQFFFEHAGYSHDPKTETPAEGRTRGAMDLAAAEAVFMAAFRDLDVGIQWEFDPEGEADYKADRKAGRLAHGIKHPDSIERAHIWHRDEQGHETSLAALCGIWDATPDYRRVIRAELAKECHDELRKLLGVKLAAKWE